MQGAAYATQEDLHAERLGNVVGHAEIEGLHDFRLVGAGREHDGAGAAEHVISVQRAQDREAVATGQLELEQHDTRTQLRP